VGVDGAGDPGCTEIPRVDTTWYDPSITCTPYDPADARKLVAVPGVGKKTADRMVLELADKVANLAPETPAGEAAAVAADDVVSALVNLGYRRSEAERAVDAITRIGPPKDFGAFLKEALKRLTGA